MPTHAPSPGPGQSTPRVRVDVATWLYPTIALVAGLLATAGLVALLAQRDTHERQMSFEYLAERTVREAELRIETLVRGLRAARGPFVASEHVTRDGFRRYFATRDFEREFVGALGVGMIERIPRDRAADLEATARAEGDPAFTIRTSGDRPELYVTRLIQPEGPNRAALGYDIVPDATRREAAELAMLTGRATLSAPIRLVQDPQHRLGMLLLLPVYRPDAPIATPQERRAACVGWTYSPLMASAVFAGLDAATRGQLDIEIFDGDHPTPDTLLSDEDGHLRGLADDRYARAHDRRAFTARRTLTLGERRVTMLLSATERFSTLADLTGIGTVGVLGALGSAALAGLVLSLTTARRRAHRLADGMVAQISAAKAAAETALREATALRTALDQHSIVSIADPRGRVIDANSAFCRISGFSRDELLGQDHSLLNSGHHPKSFWVEMWRTVAQGRAWRAEVCNRAKDGSLYWVDSTIVPCFGPDGKIEKYVSIRFDITAKKAAEAENRMLADVARRTRNGAILTDERGLILWCNEGFTRITGYTLDEVRGRSPGSVLQGEATDRDQTRAMGEAIRAGRGCTAEVVNYHKNGTPYTVRIEIEPLTDAEGKLTGFLGIETDVTEEREASRRLSRSEQFLRQTIAALDTHVAILDRHGKVVVVNEAWERFAAENGGSDVSEGADYVAVCMNALTADHDCDGAGEFLSALRAALDGRVAPPPIEYECHSPDEKRWFQAVVRRIEIEGDVFVVVAHQNVTRLQQIRAELIEGRRRVQMALDGGDLGLWDWNPQSGAVVYDQRWAAMLGYATTDLRPDVAEWASRVHPEDLARAQAALNTHFAGQSKIYECEFRMRHADGRYRWILARGRVMERDDRGRAVRVVGTHADVTERREAERRLRESEERYRTLVNTLAEGVIMQDRDGRVVACNAAAPRILGMTEHELLGLTCSDERLRARDEDGRPIPGSDHPAMVSLRTGEPVRNRVMQTAGRGGADVWLRVSSDVVRDAAGHPVLVVSSFAEITAERLAQRALADERARLEVFVAHAPAAIAMFDREMRYVAASRRWSAEYALGDAPLVGRSHYAVFPSLPERWKRIHQRCLEGAIERCDDDVWRPDGFQRDQHLRWEVRPWRDTTGAVGGLIMFTQDITESVERERELDRLREAADAANTAKSEFLANISHEMRTPLTAILGYADLLTETDAEGARQHLSTIRSAGTHLLTVINDVLDLSKIEAGRMTVETIPTDLHALLAEIDTLMRPRAAGKGVSLELRPDGPVPSRIRTDPTRLRQILMNLVGNACKFTQEGRVVVTVAARDGSLLIDVEDTGPGMTAEQASRLFQVFSQADASTSRRFGGTGLGLMISRRLANLLGGDVVLVRTAPGAGSLFRARVALDPVPDSTTFDRVEPDTPTPALESTPRPAKLSGRILLAEDGPDNQRLIAHHLRKAGATVDIADNGRIALDALDAAEAAGTPYDLLVTDMQMPEMDGYTLARTLRDRSSRIAIIALTAHAMNEDRSKCLEAGCDDYASKPIDKAALLTACAAWIGRPSVARAAA